ncbi:uncharacterized protein LOC124912336 [Impatiens glandulifera]|uniref:uncharacterized protein LOC124912336 n=1 Tax=Impatiens glandulifera TaxID=253017 RepID=UPI001FB098F1|nr:uncharacterized protein LOC124912336 [Impatiens glandulifera]
MGEFSSIPEDLVLNILSRLSIKDILRFRPVCKEWNLLLRTHRFISLHSNQSSQKRIENEGGSSLSSSFILLRSVYDETDDSSEEDEIRRLEAYYAMYNAQGDLSLSFGRSSSKSVLLTFFTLEKTISDEFDCLTVTEKEGVTIESIFSSDEELTLPSDNESIQICSPFDGLLCLAYGSQINLYNPATREVLRLPSPPPKSKFEVKSRVLCVWFESESNMKHYKVFRMVCWKVSFMIEVYDSIENRWRVIMNIVGRAYPWISVLFNGVVHFYMDKDDSVSQGMLVTIDAKSEKIGRFELPFVRVQFDESALLPFRGKLAFLQPNLDEGDDKVFVNIWVMTEYGVEESWTHEYTLLVDYIEPDEETTSYTYGTFLFYPLAFWKCMDDDDDDEGIELLVRTCDGRIVSCNLVTEDIYDLDVPCVPSCTAIIVPNNVEVLLSLSNHL